MKPGLKAILISVPLAIHLLCGAAISRADAILIAAAASLTDVLRDMGKAYQSKSKHKLLLTFGPSNFLARQIDEGAPADMFFSADLTQMDWLDKNGRLEP
ncbi:MAG: molybdate ABC transporter substrate-binding protein, partial [Deltaproteobacteria bacterium]|nr:molybdate ABC transporter substrate-binding protein [Deltaproteobacteria bacterium]